MARLPYIEPADADPVTMQVYDDAEARFEMVLNIFKITGNAPEIADKMWQIYFNILREGPSLSWVDKELLILKSTKMGDCLYCVTQHEVVSSRLGVSREKQQDIIGVEYRKSEHYTPGGGGDPRPLCPRSPRPGGHPGASLGRGEEAL